MLSNKSTPREIAAGKEMRYYCTYFDSKYLMMGLALYHSLRRHSREPFTLWILCFDEETYGVLQALAYPEMRLISQQTFEAGDEDLQDARQNRAMVEYYWTCTPSLPLYIFSNHPEVELITYLDADLYFFSDPAPIFAELGENSIGIISHRFSPELKDKERHGIYNVSVICFRRDQNGLQALRWWRERCNEWCYARLEDGKYGDQTYLDDWPVRFKNVIVLQHKGVGLAPWNLSQYGITRRGKQVWVDDAPLVFYHFHRFRMVTRNTFAPRIENYTSCYAVSFLKQNHIRFIYHPYACHLQELMRGGRSYGITKIPWNKWLQMVSRGDAFLIKPKPVSLLINKLALRD